MKKTLLIILITFFAYSLFCSEEVYHKIELTELLEDFIPDYEIDNCFSIEGIGQGFDIAKDTGEILIVTKIDNKIKIYLFNIDGEKQWEKIVSEFGYGLSYKISDNGSVIVITNYAKENGIRVGPGRGSAAGSIVSYCLGITDIDPLEHGLLFERFLNEERRSMPDIDIDFCYEKRSQVIKYVTEKYGEKRVAQLITFGTMAARQAIRDAGRVMEVTYAEVDRIAKMIPMELNVTIKNSLEMSAELREVYDNDYRMKEVMIW